MIARLSLLDKTDSSIPRVVADKVAPTGGVVVVRIVKEDRVGLTIAALLSQSTAAPVPLPVAEIVSDAGPPVMAMPDPAESVPGWGGLPVDPMRS